MHTTNQVLDLLAEKLGGASDYRLAKLLRCASASTVGNWRKGRSSLNPTYAVRVADLLGWEPAYVMACVESERAEKDSRLEDTQEIIATWQKIAERFKPAALPALLLACFALAHSSNLLAAPVDPSGENADQTIHYAN